MILTKLKEIFIQNMVEAKTTDSYSSWEYDYLISNSVSSCSIVDFINLHYIHSKQLNTIMSVQ